MLQRPRRGFRPRAQPRPPTIHRPDAIYSAFICRRLLDIPTCTWQVEFVSVPYYGWKKRDKLFTSYYHHYTSYVRYRSVTVGNQFRSFDRFVPVWFFFFCSNFLETTSDRIFSFDSVCGLLIKYNAIYEIFKYLTGYQTV